MSMNIKKEPGTPSSTMDGHLMDVVMKEGGSSSSATNSPSIPSSVTAVNSRSQLINKIKMALVHAWRDRWTEIEWAIQLKKLLAAFSSDNVDVAEILMEQGLVGSSPNSLILSYLKHSVLSLMIPFHSVLRCITKFEDFSRPYCVLALLNLAEIFGSKISLSHSQEMPLQMVGSLLKLLHWLVKALLICLKKVPDNHSTTNTSSSSSSSSLSSTTTTNNSSSGGSTNTNLPREYFVIMDNSSRAIANILERQAVRSLMQIAKADNMEEYREFEQCQMNARGTLSQLSANALPEETRDRISKALASLARIEENVLVTEPVLAMSNSPLSPIIHGLVSLEAILNRNSDTHPFVSQLITVSKLSRMPIPQVCLEMFRACFMGFMDTSEYNEDLTWATFTFLKVPHILTKMKQHLPESDMNQDVQVGMEMLLENSHLLDQMDIKLNCDMLSLLITECVKIGLLTEAQKTALSQKRAEQRNRIHITESAGSVGKSIGRVTQAENTVNSILKSLDSDPVKNSETLVKVLNMLSGHNLEIVRLAASSMGRMHEFITKLIRINEFASYPSTDMASRNQRSQLFDTTFLMITSIIQQTGMEIVHPSRENESSLVVQWARRWLPEDGKYKNPELTAAEDQEKIDRVLNMLLTNAEIIPCGLVPSWKDLITCFPFALQEILYALEHQAIGIDRVKSILDHIRHQSAKCLVLVGATYLCGYMNLVGTNARVNPLKMLEFLTQGLDSTQLKLIIDSVVFDILPEGHPQRPARRYLLPRSRLTGEVIHETLSEAFHRGWLNLSALHTLDQLLSVRGPDWVVGEIVELLMGSNQLEDFYQALHLAFAIMHMDLERMTISLLHTALPRLLTQNTCSSVGGSSSSNSDTPNNNNNASSAASSNALSHPRGYCLAKLCVLCITATRTYKFGQKEPYVRRLCKRSIMEIDFEEDLEDTDTSPSKLRKMSEPQLSFSMEEFNLDMWADKEENSESVPTFVLKEPFNKVLVNLFHLMNSILTLPTLTPQTWFIVSFIQEAVKCGGEHTRFILQFMPQNMLSQIMRCLPGVFSSDHILRICDLSTPAGRKVAAKVICNNAQVAPLDIID